MSYMLFFPTPHCISLGGWTLLISTLAKHLQPSPNGHLSFVLYSSFKFAGQLYFEIRFNNSSLAMCSVPVKYLCFSATRKKSSILSNAHFIAIKSRSHSYCICSPTAKRGFSLFHAPPCL